MMMDRRKRTVTAILSKMRPDGSETMSAIKPESELDEHDEDLKSISEDLLMAVKGDSAHDVMVALKAFWDCIQDADEGQDKEMMK